MLFRSRAERLLPPERVPELPGRCHGHPRPRGDRGRPAALGLRLSAHRIDVPALAADPRAHPGGRAARGAPPDHRVEHRAAVPLRFRARPLTQALPRSPSRSQRPVGTDPEHLRAAAAPLPALPARRISSASRTAFRSTPPAAPSASGLDYHERAPGPVDLALRRSTKVWSSHGGAPRAVPTGNRKEAGG